MRHLLEQQNNNNLLPQPHLLAPVNFRTSPPLEALKPHRSHPVQRPTTPLVLAERGIENIKISATAGSAMVASATNGAIGGSAQLGATQNASKCDSPTTIVQQQQQQQAGSHRGHHSHHHPHHLQFDQNRSVSPPAKVFHCAVSPSRRRQSRHQTQRLQRPHRPCLDFDKMQQVSKNLQILQLRQFYSKKFPSNGKIQNTLNF